MPSAAYLQTNFLGGEWSPFAQGRADMEQYVTAMNLCYNTIPLEVGAATRRPGTLFCATTRNGDPAALKTFHFSEANPYAAEFTAGHLRIFAGASLLLENATATSVPVVVVGISSANPAVVEVSPASGFSTGDQVEIELLSPAAGESLIGNRQFSVTVIDVNHFSISDPVTGDGVDGSQITYAPNTATVSRVVTFLTDYTEAQLPSLRMVQDENVAFVCIDTQFPQALINSVPPLEAQTAVFTWTTPTFQDGPYLDPPTDGSTLTPGATTGDITITASSTNSINGGQGFLSTDVGRMIRLFSQPSAWLSGTSYAKGSNVYFNDVAWQAVQSNQGIEPDTDNGTNWVIDPSGAAWSWGLITAVANTTHCTLALAAADPYGQLAGGPLLYTTAVTVWQLGLYSETTGYPSGGCFHEGRFWLFGAIQNRMDSNMANNNGDPENGVFLFSPTLLDGTVADNCGISAVFNGDDRNTIFWAAPGGEGIIVGTQAGEWLMQSSSLNEPITPTSIQAHRVTKYGCANIEPRDTGLSHVFVQRYSLAVYEYLADIFSRKMIGFDIARKTKHITAPGIAELAYQAAKSSIVWARTTDGRLLGCTYRRDSTYSTQPPTFQAWHRHALGSGRIVEGIQGGPSPDGNTDSLMLVTNDPATNIRYVEMLSQIPDEVMTLQEAWYVDGAVTPSFASIVGSDLVLYGLQYIAGDTVTAWIGGLDAGDYTVSAQGTVTIPLDGTANGTGGALLTEAYLQGLGGSFSNLNLNIFDTPAGPGIGSPVASVTNFVGNGVPVSDTQNVSGMVDWAGGFGYFVGPDIGDGGGLHKFALTAPGTEIGYVKLDDYNSSLNNQTCGQDGNCYLLNNTLAGIIKVVGSDMVQTEQDLSVFGTSMGGQTTTLQAGDQTFILLKSVHGVDQGTSGLFGYEYFIWNVTQGIALPGSAGTGPVGVGQTQSNDGDFNSGPCRFVRGPSLTNSEGVNYGTAFVLESSPTDNTHLYINQVTVSDQETYGFLLTGSILCTDIESDWTSISICGGIYDPFDGGLILCLVGQGGATNPNYMVKVSQAGAVIWKTAVVGNIVFSDNSVLGNQRLSVIADAGVGGGFFRCYTFNTATGAETHIDENAGAVSGQDQYTSDYVGQIIAFGPPAHWPWFTFGQGAGGPPTPATSFNIPALVGFNYTSQAQILRPVTPQQGGFQTGPGQGKLRRSHYAAPLMANAQNVEMGVDFRKMRPMKFKSAGGTVALPLTSLYSGVYWEPVDDDYTRDSMWCWQSSRPYPCTVVSVEVFIEGYDNG